MKLKNAFLLILTIATYSVANAQKVKLKNENVFIAGEKKFKYEKRALTSEFSLYTIDKQNEILFIHVHDNETSGNVNDDYNQITFIKENRKLETSALKGNSYKWFIQKLIKEKVLDLEGNINTEKLDTFFAKYNENITNRTIRY